MKTLLNFLLIMILLPLIGCGQSTQGNILRGEIKERGAEIADAALENAEWVFCEAMSIGSLRRKYGDKPKMAEAYRELCERTISTQSTSQSHLFGQPE